MCLAKPVRQSELYDAIVGALPAPALEALAGDPAAPDARGSGVRGRILLAEDNPLNRQVALAMLEKLNLSVEVAADGRAAVAAWERERWDAILMDCHMPAMDGFEAMRQIRAREAAGAGARGAATPIVAVTASAHAGDREACLAAGFDGYLAKPYKLVELRDALARWLGSPLAAGPAVAEPAAGGAEDPGALPDADAPIARQAGDRERMSSPLCASVTTGRLTRAPARACGRPTSRTAI